MNPLIPEKSGNVPSLPRSRPVIAAVVIVVAAAIAGAVALSASVPQLSARDQDWRQDIAFLSGRLPQVHVGGLTGGTTRSQWDTAAARLEAQVPQLSNGEIITGMARIVAMLRDDETTVARRLVARLT